MLEKKVFKFICNYNLILPGEKVLVAVSGGPDSVCLLHLLYRLRSEGNFTITAAHLDHALRNQSQEDSRYVQSLCFSLNIPLVAERRDVNAFRKEHHLSLEEAARLVRYDFLIQTALSLKADKIAVAHTADDQVETVLLNLVRGTGLRGLKGMSPLSHHNGLPIIRPLLWVTRKETEEYCRTHNLSPIQDLSNLNLYFRRNFLRLKVIPLLERLNPRFKESLLSTSFSLTQDLDFIDQQLKQWEGIVERMKEGIRIDREGWLKLGELQPHLLLKLGEEMGVSLEAKHIRAAMAITPGKSLNLPRGLKLIAEPHYLWLTFSSPPCPYPPLKGIFELNIPGITQVGGWKVEAEVKEAPVELSPSPFIACLDLDKSGRRIFVRPRICGDRFFPLGLGGEKKIQDFMVDAKIPRLWRERIPVVVSDKQVLWLVGYRIDERAKVTPQTKQVLRLNFLLP